MGDLEIRAGVHALVREDLDGTKMARGRSDRAERELVPLEIGRNVVGRIGPHHDVREVIGAGEPDHGHGIRPHPEHDVLGRTGQHDVDAFRVQSLDGGGAVGHREEAEIEPGGVLERLLERTPFALEVLEPDDVGHGEAQFGRDRRGGRCGEQRQRDRAGRQGAAGEQGHVGLHAVMNVDRMLRRRGAARDQ